MEPPRPPLPSTSAKSGHCEESKELHNMSALRRLQATIELVELNVTRGVVDDETPVDWDEVDNSQNETLTYLDNGPCPFMYQDEVREICAHKSLNETFTLPPDIEPILSSSGPLLNMDPKLLKLVQEQEEPSQDPESYLDPQQKLDSNQKLDLKPKVDPNSKRDQNSKLDPNSKLDQNSKLDPKPKPPQELDPKDSIRNPVMLPVPNSTTVIDESLLPPKNVLPRILPKKRPPITCMADIPDAFSNKPNFVPPPKMSRYEEEQCENTLNVIRHLFKIRSSFEKINMEY